MRCCYCNAEVPRTMYLCPNCHVLPFPIHRNSANDPMEKLRKLKQLLDEEIITDAEYEEKRQKLPDEI